VLVERVELDSRRSPYLTLGDLPAGLCLLATCSLAAVGWWQGRKSRRLPVQ